MTKEDKQNLADKKLSNTLIIGCLTTCESVISKNAYLEKKWSNCYRYGDVQRGSTYYYERLEWMGYREKLCSLLLPIYPMKMIIHCCSLPTGQYVLASCLASPHCCCLSLGRNPTDMYGESLKENM